MQCVASDIRHAGAAVLCLHGTDDSMLSGGADGSVVRLRRIRRLLSTQEIVEATSYCLSELKRPLTLAP